jgi:oligoendopeptidase F
MSEHTAYTPKPHTRIRREIDERYRWNVDDIFSGWDEWEAALKELDAKIGDLAAFKGTLADGEGVSLLRFQKLHDEVSILSYRLWYYPMLIFDTDQRNNEVDARRQQVQELFSRLNTEISWFAPEALAIGLDTVRKWMDKNDELALYRFAIEELYRQAKHVLDEQGEHLLSLSSMFGTTPSTSFQMLSTADARFREVELSGGETVKVTPGAYRSFLATLREQSDREKVFRGHYEPYDEHKNTYAAIYAGVLHRGLFHARARQYDSVLEMKLHDNNIPVSVVETLVQTAKDGTEPLRRYHALRKQALELDKYHLYDSFAPLTDLDPRYGYDEVKELIADSVAPLGSDYRARLVRATSERWIDVFENEGKRSGAYSAGVYGVHPYMLLNWNDTLDDVFTLAHELGHTMHTMLSDEHQPFVYSQYTIFVAEVASTLNEALLLNTLLARTDDPAERVMLLQHAIDGIAGTFYTQSLFADYELHAHRAVEAGQPITADYLSSVYWDLLQNYYGDSIDHDELYKVTWARIPHFFQSPYYVYQYATSHAASAQIFQQIADGGSSSKETVEKYLSLLKSGGSDHPMTLLKRAGVDISDPETLRAVPKRLESLLDLLEEDLVAVRHG